ncbi:helix-turn-helix transcriptional regulator [Streptomyces sp. N50]|uniref:helix-turn-helix transcriptional regulator n=1 Tax=Streptomyces sp. N50 TaxID=3081765 RepID=UPI002962266E|nr:helix-turn-helix transcriptional regulator [Streptomyces sp. N50]WOX11334.1 helix-turn-helix transcriptional regulator [Streptomyces sp. N50]
MDRQTQDPREVVAGLLDDSRFLGTCSERDMGAMFRMLNHRGISTRRIAAAVDITQGRLYDYMNGKSRVEKLTLFEQIADAFHISGHLLGLARRSWEPAVDSQPHQPQPPPDGDDLTAMDAFRLADRQTGGGRLYGAVVQHLRDRVAPRLVDLSDGGGVFAAAAALTEMAGWMAHDGGRDGDAVGHFGRALALAQTGGDLPLAAHVAASLSHLVLQGDDAPGAARWARTGLDLAGRGPRIPALASRLHTMQARAMAAADQRRAAHDSLDQARRDLDASAGTAHPWLSPFDHGRLASEAALVLVDLDEYDEALAAAEEAVALRDAGRARSLALARITLADIHVRRGDLDAALDVGHDLLATSPTLGSVRVVQQLDDFRALLEPHRSYGPVHEYLVRFGDARRARMFLLADLIPSPGGPRR